MRRMRFCLAVVLTYFICSDASHAQQTGCGEIAFYSTRDGREDIYVVAADGTNLRRLTNGDAGGLCPAFSPDGRKIAFLSRRDGNEEIYVMDDSGRNVRRLTFSSSVERHAAWSPDGTGIVFQSDRDGNKELYVMNADGSHPRRLTHDSAEDMWPAWSPDGRNIIFNSDRDGNWEVYSMDADGHNVRRLTNSPQWEFKPALSPDGTLIAFRSGPPGVFQGDIHVMNLDCTGEKKLTHLDGVEEDPVWSPDGTQIAFQTMKDGNFEIYVMQTDGRNWRRLTEHPVHDYWPSWAPRAAPASSPTASFPAQDVELTVTYNSDATESDSLSLSDQKSIARPSESGEQPGEYRGRIAFYSTRDGHDEIYMVDADGSNLRRLTTGNSNSQCPALSPDGRRIAFQMNRGDSKDIYVMDTDGRNVQRLTDSPFSERHAAWSRDGSRIAFQSGRDGNPELYVMDADGSNWRRLTHNPAEEVYPSWSPDGTHIAFSSYRDENWEIYIVNSDGTGLRRITDTPEWELCPAWSPDGTKIAFRSGRARVFEGDIHVIHPDGTGEHRLTHAVGMEEHPAWSPDGKHIAFQAMKDGTMDVYAMESAGGPWRNLSQHRAHDYWPTWGPAEAGALLGKQNKLPIFPHDVRLQIVYDDNAHTKNLQTGAGFSCLIRIKDRTLLFDTGANGRTLLSNMATLAVDPAAIDQIVVSHNHSDHLGGLPRLLEVCKPPVVYLLAGVPSNVSGLGVELVTQAVDRAKQQAGKVVEITDPIEISDNVFTTGRMGTRIPEQALIVRTRAGLIVITGCGHPGVIEIVKRARELLGEDVLLVMGGFHLVGKDMADIQGTVSELRQLTSHVAPCHCSGDTARELFKRAFENHYVEVGVGKTVNPSELAGK